MTDPQQFFWDGSNNKDTLARRFEVNDFGPPTSCCARCKDMITEQRKKFRFAGYSKIAAQTANELTPHQYFLCDRMAEAFVFGLREWRRPQLAHSNFSQTADLLTGFLEVSGFKEARFDTKVLDTLVLDDHIKKMIQSLTEKHIVGLKADWEGEQVLGKRSPGVESKKSAGSSTWSADYVKGKGEGLIFLLHGKPGVGKTYTAGQYPFPFKKTVLSHLSEECISTHFKRPLLNLTATDLGTEPHVIEQHLAKWFKLAARWNAVLLIDEADIYMEHRSVQDIARNSLVAGFLRALEYFKGVLFLTTNRVGHFDEAFISRINMTIYYRPFNEQQRRELWESYFRKLQKEREDRMRIHLNTRDYVEESEDLRKLEWNGREIKNGKST